MNECIDNTFFFTDLEDRYIVAIYYHDFIETSTLTSDLYEARVEVLFIVLYALGLVLTYFNEACEWVWLNSK